MIRPGEVICTERPHRDELYMRILWVRYVMWCAKTNLDENFKNFA